MKMCKEHQGNQKNAADTLILCYDILHMYLIQANNTACNMIVQCLLEYSSTCWNSDTEHRIYLKL